MGGFYAAGWSPAELEALLLETDWTELFSDRPTRDEKSFRRKQDDVNFLIPLKLRFKGLKPYIPPAVIAGKRIGLFLNSLELRSTGERDFDRLPIPYRAVAADILDGSAVILSGGSLSQAMRASMAVPAMFPPVEIEGRRLVDGGADANLPIGIAQSLGADAVIAIDITSPLSEEEHLESLFSILGQQSSFLTVGNRKEDVKRLRPGDVLIRPDLGDLSFLDFAKAMDAVKAGEKATRAAADALRPFALSNDAWSAFVDRHRRHPQEDRTIDDLRLENGAPVDDRIVFHRLQLHEGEPFNTEDLGQDVLRLHALDYFGVIRPDFTREGSTRVLSIATPRKPYGRNSLQFGANVQDDFQGDSNYAVSARHQFLAANHLGGEWQNVVQIGDAAMISTEFYQPLDYGMRWFAVPSFSTKRLNQPIWVDGDPVAEYRLSAREGRLDGGTVLGDWGEVRAGVFMAQTRGSLRTGDPVVPDFSERDAGAEASFRVDTLDNTAFPTRGMRAEATYTRALEALGSDVNFERVSGRLNYAFSLGKNIVIPGFEVNATLDGPTTLYSAYPLGGFLRLSGLGTNELFGRSGGLVRLIYYRNLWTVGLGALRTPLYAGISLESGNVYQEGERLTWDSLRCGAAVFVGADTALGPVYLSYGIADGGRHRVYLNVGTRF